MSVAVRAEALTHAFGDTLALDAMNLTVEEGSITGLVGPNGAGKTTTFLVLCSLLRPMGGRAEVAGVDVLADPREVRRAVGYMPDFFGIYDDLRVAEYLRFFGASYGLRGATLDARVDEMLDLVDLTARRDSYVETISRGMKQRLCLARALIHDPRVLILDEPAAGLDPQGRALLRSVLLRVRDAGTTVVISSHVLSDLEDLCTHYAVMADGHVVAEGDRHAMLSGGAVRVRILAPAEAADTIAACVSRAGGRHEVTAPGIFTATLRSGDDRASLLAALVRAKVAVQDYTTMGELEDAFLRLTRDA